MERLNDGAAKITLADLGIQKPLRLCAENIGVVLDAGGTAVLVVDQYRDRADEDVIAIATLIVEAVNATTMSEDRAQQIKHALLWGHA